MAETMKVVPPAVVKRTDIDGFNRVWRRAEARRNVFSIVHPRRKYVDLRLDTTTAHDSFSTTVLDALKALCLRYYQRHNTYKAGPNLLWRIGPYGLTMRLRQDDVEPFFSEATEIIEECWARPSRA